MKLYSTWQMLQNQQMLIKIIRFIYYELMAYKKKKYLSYSYQIMTGAVWPYLKCILSKICFSIFIFCMSQNSFPSWIRLFLNDKMTLCNMLKCVLNIAWGSKVGEVQDDRIMHSTWKLISRVFIIVPLNLSDWKKCYVFFCLCCFKF